MRRDGKKESGGCEEASGERGVMYCLNEMICKVGDGISFDYE